MPHPHPAQIRLKLERQNIHASMSLTFLYSSKSNHRQNPYSRSHLYSPPSASHNHKPAGSSPSNLPKPNPRIAFTSCYFGVFRWRDTSQFPRRPIHNPLFPFHNHQVAFPWRAVGQDSHAAFRIHHVVEVCPLVLWLPFPVWIYRGVRRREVIDVRR